MKDWSQLSTACLKLISAALELANPPLDLDIHIASDPAETLGKADRPIPSVRRLQSCFWQYDQKSQWHWAALVVQFLWGRSSPPSLIPNENEDSDRVIPYRVNQLKPVLQWFDAARLCWWHWHHWSKQVHSCIFCIGEAVTSSGTSDEWGYNKIYVINKQ